MLWLQCYAYPSDKRPASKSEGALPGRGLPSMPVDELLQERREFSHLIGAAFPQLMGHGLRNVSAAPLRDVETYHEHGVVELACQRVADDGIQAGVADI